MNETVKHVTLKQFRAVIAATLLLVGIVNIAALAFLERYPPNMGLLAPEEQVADAASPRGSRRLADPRRLQREPGRHPERLYTEYLAAQIASAATTTPNTRTEAFHDGQPRVEFGNDSRQTCSKASGS